MSESANPVLTAAYIFAALRMSKRRVRKTRFRKPIIAARRREAVKVYPSGREVCADTKAGLAEYNHRIEQMYYRDNRECCICHERINFLDEATFEHKQGRGMGGGHRDDRIEFGGVAHYLCNTKKGSIRQAVETAICMDCDSDECYCGGVQ